MISNFSKYCRQFEEQCRNYLGVNYALSQSNATSGLLIATRALGLTGEVITTSFTFSATIHALSWNNLTPVFVDIDPETFNLDPKGIEEKITPRTTAIMATHIFGNPCDVEELECIAKKYGLRLIFDAAHAFGSQYQGKRIGGFGDVEIFSFSPTKLLVTGEGGLMTFNNLTLLNSLKIGRDYGNPGNYDCQYVGFNSKMQEFCAIVGLQLLPTIDEQIRNRNRIRELYIGHLSTLRGITFQKIKEGNLSSLKDFSIIINPSLFGMDRDTLVACLTAENIHTRNYFYPPIHQMTAYANFRLLYEGKLPHTERIAKNIICLPMHSYMSEDTIIKIYRAIARIQEYAVEIIAKRGV
ncbi:DegT/DnrJ/EryC1/StrS family aminotransferase [Candidatus Woesearchaeota archaeon]|nr:DegT/DnrJ/EryC1/StrS family aminotransferase [Candidatus Woesearchaeota archaeon]